MAVEQMIYNVLLAELVQNIIRHPCIVPVQLFSKRSLKVQFVQSYSIIDMVALWKNSCIFSLERSVFNVSASRPPPPKLPKISVVNKSPNEEVAFELRSRVEEICQYWSVCL